MNKYFFLALVLLACNNPKNLKEDTKVTPRDVSITKANAYSDVFLDSTSMEAFITEQKLSDTLALRMRSFYNARNYQYAWFNSTGFTEQTLGFWNLQEYIQNYTSDSLQIPASLQKQMDVMFGDDYFKVADNNKIRETELQLTNQFLAYSLNTMGDGLINREALESFIPKKKASAIAVTEEILKIDSDKKNSYSESNKAYGALLKELKKYHEIVKNGGWQKNDASPKDFKSGDSSSHIVALKSRLRITEDYNGDSSNVLNDDLTKAIERFELRHGLSPTGKVSTKFLEEANVPAEERLKQILINLDRMQWLIQRPQHRLLMVNIPEFKLHVMEGEKDVFSMNVVVGKAAHQTVIFTGGLNQVVFSPYWNVPTSIVKNEILPDIEANSNYLAENNMEIVEDGPVPVIRQKPGASNALGKVKFLFPNKFNIYFHDTPAKSLFGNDARAYSHGCIRLAEPNKLAEYLLKDQSEWTKDKMQAAMNSGVEKTVVLKEKVPVLITYYTAWVDENGLLHFAPDIYKHDQQVKQYRFL